MFLKVLSSLVRDYFDATLQGILGSIECKLRRFLYGAVLCLSGAAMVLFGGYIVLGGIFLYLSQKPQFLIPAFCTAFISVLAGSLLLMTGSSMSKLTEDKKVKLCK